MKKWYHWMIAIWLGLVAYQATWYLILRLIKLINSLLTPIGIIKL